MSDVDMFCVLCRERVPDGHTDKALRHMMDEHRDAAMFQAFMDDVRVTNHCRRCGTRFDSRVEVFEEVFGARPYCPGCRDGEPAFRELRTERLSVRELIARAHVVTG